MKANPVKIVGLLALVALAAFGYFELSTDTPDETIARPSNAPSAAQSAPVEAPVEVRAPRSDGVLRVVDDTEIKDYGKVIYRGSVDLSATIERIRAGVKHSHRNDGSVFGNRERILPSQPRGYYREYVHPTPGLNGPGPQRLVVGRDGDWWYTPDHYASFIALGREVRR